MFTTSFLQFRVFSSIIARAINTRLEMKDCVKVLQLINLHNKLHIRYFRNRNTVVLHLGPFKDAFDADVTQSVHRPPESLPETLRSGAV